VLPQVAKLSKTLQTEKLDVTVVSSLVKATLYSIDDALTTAANWVLTWKKAWRKQFRSRSHAVDDIKSFQKKPEYLLLKANISSCFGSQDVVSAFSIFDPKKIYKLQIL